MAKTATVDTPVSANAEAPQKSETPAAPIAPLTQSDLLSIIATMQQQLIDGQRLQAEANKALAEAIIDSKKPYVDPRKKLNDEMFKDQERQIALRTKMNVQYAQSTCEHIAGCSQLSEQKDIAGRTSFVWHRNDIGVDIGVCTVCQKILRPEDPDYALWRRKSSFNKLSAAGTRTFMDPLKARSESYLHDS